MARLPGRTLFLLSAAAVLLLDQATKGLLRAAVPPGESRELVPGLLRLVHLWNPGVAFGLLAHPSPWRRALLSLTNAVAAVVLYLVFRRAGRREAVLGGLVAGGALGNLVDRVRFGQVFDFLDLHLGPHHWPAFNLADAAVTIGVLLLVLEQTRQSRAGGRR